MAPDFALFVAPQTVEKQGQRLGAEVHGQCQETTDATLDTLFYTVP